MVTPVVIPAAAYAPPEFRLLYRKDFGVDESSGNYDQSSPDWFTLNEPPMDSFDGSAQFSGVELLKVNRRTLPDIGTASFRMIFGGFANGQQVLPPNLKYMTVRLQLRPRYASADITAGWKTVFLGHVDYQTDEVYAGSDSNTEQGVRTYYCVDIFARTMKWYMDRHATDVFNDGSQLKKECYGHPGYNYMPSGEGPVLGNRSNATVVRGAGAGAGAAFYAHIWAGAHSTGFVGQTWTEQQVVEHATASVRPQGEPWFRLAGTWAANFSNITPLTVEDDDTVQDFCSKVLNRNRGFGTVLPDWLDAVDGSIHTFLTCGPLVIADSFIDVEGGPGVSGTVVVRLLGADGAQYRDIAGNPLTLTGDARNVDTAEVADAEMQQCDYVETLGERIEVAMTGSLADCGGVSQIYTPTLQISLAPRWSGPTGDVGSFEGLTTERRIMPYWDHVYQLFGLPRNWNFQERNAGWGPDTGGIHRIDYRLLDTGEIYCPTNLDPQDTSPIEAEICDNVPFFQGYDYSSYYPTKTDNTPQQGLPTRRPAALYLHLTTTSDDRWFLPNGELPQVIADKFQFNNTLGNWCPTLNVFPDAIQVRSDYFQQFGMRAFADLSRDAALDSTHALDCVCDITQIAITFGVRLPHRLRLCSTTAGFPTKGGGLGGGPVVADPAQARRRKKVEVPNCHFWLAAYNCIWDLDQGASTDTDVSEGYLARRNPLGAEDYLHPAVLRSDLPRLALYHLAASAWYLVPRKRAAWTQAYCGFLPFDRTGFPGDTAPQVGAFIDTLNYNGVTDTINAPVTEMEYDHQAHRTSWKVDYFDLEFNL